MKIVFITGSHPRHRFIARALARTGKLAAIVSEERGAHVPEPPAGLTPATEKLFRHHFARRSEAEEAFFGSESWPDVPILHVESDAINSTEVRDLLRDYQPGLLMSYGCHKLDDDTLACAPGERWNIHGGLSPWYKGAITHFWPSYMLEPQMTGMTVHDLTNQLDAGAVVHQCTADLVRSDGLHELACRAVANLGEELPSLVDKLTSGAAIPKKAHKTGGKLWRAKEWRPEHLHLIYEVYGDKIVDAYLDGRLSQDAPSLHRQFD